VNAAEVAALALAPDPAVPGRDLLLDSGEMAARLSRLLARNGRPLRIDRYRRGRVKYRVGDSLRFVHDLEIDGAPHVVASRTFRNGRREEVYARALQTARPAGSLPAVAEDPQLGAVFWTFPNDRKIATLPALTPATETVARLLGRPIARTVLAAYAPEHSATAACLDELGRPVAYAKVFAAAEDLEAAHAAHATVFDLLGASRAALHVPAVLAFSAEDRMLIVEAVDGRRIDSLRGPELLRATRQVGAALATLHSLPVPAALRAFDRLAPERQPRSAELIARARPDVAGAAARLADELFAEPPAADAPVCLHGDVHLKNVLLQHRRVALIDLDQVGVGPAAADVGSALAGLRYHALIADELARGARLQDALLEGYASRRELPDRETLRWHVAAALLTERALRAVNRIRPDVLVRLGEVLTEARTVLGREPVR
jgi:Ser/Thr protein kinase RdoA (MazF antagonist)